MSRFGTKFTDVAPKDWVYVVLAKGDVWSAKPDAIWLLPHLSWPRSRSSLAVVWPGVINMRGVGLWEHMPVSKTGASIAQVATVQIIACGRLAGGHQGG